MLSADVVYLVRQEQGTDRLRAIEREQLIKAVQARQSVPYQRVAYWLGARLLKWSTKLHRHDPNPLQTGQP